MVVAMAVTAASASAIFIKGAYHKMRMIINITKALDLPPT
jgi:hypothetical protein